jgi:2-hydroxychromene-2-carboxylate isomerase
MIEIFFDFISPYAYLGCSRIRALGERVGHDVEPRPVTDHYRGQSSA